MSDYYIYEGEEEEEEEDYENYDYDDEYHDHLNDAFRGRDEDADEDFSEVELRDCHMYLPREHANNVLMMLKKQYETSQHLDITIKTADKEVKAHKCLVAACIPYIRTYLENCPDTESINLSHLNSNCVCQIIEWCYTGLIKVSISDVQDFLVSADFLCIDQVFKNCTDFILKRLTLENCYEIYSLACTFQACDFKKKVKQYILNHPVELFKQNLLGTIPKDEMVEIVADPSLIITDDEGYPMMDGDQEFQLFKLVCKYISQNNLEHYWPDLLKGALRLSLLSEQQLREIIAVVDALNDSSDRQACLTTLNITLHNRKAKRQENPACLKPRKNLESWFFCVLCGVTDEPFQHQQQQTLKTLDITQNVF